MNAFIRCLHCALFACHGNAGAENIYNGCRTQQVQRRRGHMTACSFQLSSFSRRPTSSLSLVCCIQTLRSRRCGRPRGSFSLASTRSSLTCGHSECWWWSCFFMDNDRTPVLPLSMFCTI